jgi:hypothetical protein
MCLAISFRDFNPRIGGCTIYRQLNDRFDYYSSESNDRICYNNQSFE